MKPAVVVLFAAMASTSFAASKEPFVSFRFFDRQLSALNQGAADVKASTDPYSRRRALHQMRLSALRIQRRSEHLERLYRARHSSYGVKTFAAIDRDAVAVERAIVAIQRKKPEADARLEKATLALVLMYQSATSNYGANHCQAGQWACCEPKRDPETNRQSGQGCRWMCVSKTESCSGFLGPRTLK